MELDGLNLFSGSELSGLTVPTVTSLPDTPQKGRVVVHSGEYKIYNGASWIVLSEDGPNPPFVSSAWMEFDNNSTDEGNFKSVEANVGVTYLANDSRPSTAGGSVFIDSTTGRIAIQPQAQDDFYFPPGTDFTIELFARFNPANTFDDRFLFGFGGGNMGLFVFGVARWNIQTGANWLVGPNRTQPINVTKDNSTWNHIAVTRSGNTISFYENGLRVQQDTSGTVTLGALGSSFYLGNHAGGTWGSGATYDGLRITRGTARYIGGSHTVPSGDYT